jgi:hypothetical protein
LKFTYYLGCLTEYARRISILFDLFVPDSKTADGKSDIATEEMGAEGF